MSPSPGMQAIVPSGSPLQLQVTLEDVSLCKGNPVMQLPWGHHPGEDGTLCDDAVL